MAALQQVQPVEDGEPSSTFFQIVWVFTPRWTFLYFCTPAESEVDYLFYHETEWKTY